MKKIKNLINEIKWFIQRGKRGYADCDLWDFHTYHARLMYNGLRDFNKMKHGYPAYLEPGIWDDIISQIADGFEAAEKIANDDGELFEEIPNLRNELVAKFHKAIMLLKTYYFHLWD